jgi:hypothetical protein
MLHKTYLHFIFRHIKTNSVRPPMHPSPTFPIARQTHWRLSRCVIVSAVDCNSPQVVRLRRDVQSACTISVTCTHSARSKVFIHNTSARHCYYSHYRREPCKVKTWRHFRWHWTLAATMQQNHNCWRGTSTWCIASNNTTYQRQCRHMANGNILWLPWNAS